MFTVAEWHPYTLTSAPDDPFLSVHIQVCGDWTGAVYNYLSEYLETIQVRGHTLPRAIMPLQTSALG